MASVLGKKVEYSSKYDSGLLVPIARSIGREELGALEKKFFGGDIWNCYELSWLNANGKPEVKILQLFVPTFSPNIVESKSLKLYLNSFNNTKFNSSEEVIALIKQDLSKVTGSELDVKLVPVHNFSGQFRMLQGTCIDDLDVVCEDYMVNKDLLDLELNQQKVTETLYSELLKSNCPVTNQPDWASVQINYTGNKIARKSLLKYVVSYRWSNEFHEQCIERMFVDIEAMCKPQHLTIYGRFTRRGGIDINPIRSSRNITNIRNDRTSRQ